MSVFVVSELSGLDNFWILDVMAGIKAEADKKNLHCDTFPLDVKTGNDSPVVLVVGYSDLWLENTCRRVIECGARPICVNAPASALKTQVAGSVSFDYDGAMSEVLSYLAECGKRDIAFIGCRGNRVSFDCKKNAFIKNAPEHYFSHADVLHCEEIGNIAEVFMSQPTRYDAVICSRDAEAGALAMRLQKNGIRLPEDVFVLSFGDSKMAERFTPMLSSVKVDFKELGREAVRLSRYLSQERETCFVNCVVRCPLIIRGSTADIQRQHDASVMVPKPISYKTDAEYLSYLQAEELVRIWDSLDKKIVAALLEGRNTASVAEKLFISHSSVKYRIRKMLNLAKIKDRSELISLVARYKLL